MASTASKGRMNRARVAQASAEPTHIERMIAAAALADKGGGIDLTSLSREERLKLLIS